MKMRLQKSVGTFVDSSHCIVDTKQASQVRKSDSLSAYCLAWKEKEK
jgi:hypothetical protein